ncbi:nickel-dependent lactate racemase [Candidatus Bathyarchaeota archaeon]|nr:MAG: nickel-dependent lactate racemase [Candidatus Bathyarchaeota archaeon]
MSDMRITIPYGKDDTVQMDAPDENLAWVIDRKHKPALKNPVSALKAALRNPISSQPLGELAKGAGRVVILVDDNTRPTPQHLILPPILDELNGAGVPDADIEVIIALGTHRKMTEDEIEKRFGRTVARRVRISNFDCHDAENLVNIGRTASGVEVIVSKRVHSADLIIGVGNIVPHCYAGWAGGGKIVQPGVCGVETIEATHIVAGKTRPISSLVGSLDHTARRMIDEIALQVGLRFIVNTILNEDDEVADFVVGHPIEAFHRGVELAREIYCPEIPALADIVVVSSYPADLEYWQASKPADYACLGVKKGGVIILVTPSPEGVASVHPELRELGLLSYDEVVAAYERDEIQDHIAAAALMLHSQIREHAEVICVSHGMTKEDKKALGFVHADTVQEALELAFLARGREAKVGVMKCGDIMPIIIK